MLNRSKFLIKRFISSTSTKTTFSPFKYRQLPFFPSHHTTKPVQALSNSPLSSSPFSSFFKWRRNKYKEDISLLKGFNEDQLTYIHSLFDEYASSSDLQAFSLGEIKRIVSILQYLSGASQKRGDINQAKSYLSEAEEICNKLNIKNTKEVANNHFMRASYYFADHQDSNKAEEHLDEAERICWLFDDDKEMKCLMVRIDFYRAFLSRRRSENDKALELLSSVFNRASDIDDRILPKILLVTHLEMGSIYTLKENYDKAKECLSKSLKIATDHFGEYSEEAFQASSNLFKFYYHTKENQEALYYAKKNLQIALKIFPKENLNIAWCYEMLANLYLRTGEIDKVLEALEETIKICEKSPQEHHMILSDLYCRASNFYHFQGKNQEASILLRKSNEMFARINFENNHKTIEIYLYRAEEFKCFRRWDESEDCLRKALKICQGLEQPLNKLKIVDINFLLGEVLYEKQDWDAALQLFQETEKLFQECSAESFKLYLLYSYLGSLSTITKDYDKAVHYFERAIECCEMVGDIGFLLSLYFCLEKVYKRQEMRKEKEELVKKFRKCTENFDQRDPNVQAGMKKAFRIFWIIASLDEANLL